MVIYPDQSHRMHMRLAPNFVDIVLESSKEMWFFQVRSLEAQGLPSKQAEAITGAITEVLNDSLGVVSQLVVCKGEMQKVSFNLRLASVT